MYSENQMIQHLIWMTGLKWRWLKDWRNIKGNAGLGDRKAWYWGSNIECGPR